MNGNESKPTPNALPLLCRMSAVQWNEGLQREVGSIGFFFFFFFFFFWCFFNQEKQERIMCVWGVDTIPVSLASGNNFYNNQIKKELNQEKGKMLTNKKKE
eukprot:Rhum_TRINITY_DN14677_c14_g6::Rhum_TRINITY_DN14677_c14_g6_i1::g.109636::m.109636